jgi:HAD superfamily hydrolase (TIGR01549 family)
LVAHRRGRGGGSIAPRSNADLSRSMPLSHPVRDLDTIFLDAGGVLVWPNWSRVAAALHRHGVAVPPERLAAADPLARLEIDREELIAASTDQRRGWTYFELVLTHAGVALTPQTEAALDGLREYHREHNLWETVPDFVVPALQRLRAAGYRLVIVSNSNGTLHRAFARLGLAPLVDMILDSAVEGVEKPDPRFFQLALSRADARPHTTVHVGDLYHVDVAGARAAGVSAVLVDECDVRSDVDCPRIRSIASLPEWLAQR